MARFSLHLAAKPHLSALARSVPAGNLHDRLKRKRQPLAAYRFGGLECMLLGPGEGGLMSMIG